MRNSSGKRDFGESGSIGRGGEMPLQKKRFVWPERTHNDFVAAVFDAGLKHLMEEESDYAWNSIMSAHEKESPAQIRRHVLKILAYRISEKKERMLKDGSLASVEDGSSDDKSNHGGNEHGSGGNEYSGLDDEAPARDNGSQARESIL